LGVHRVGVAGGRDEGVLVERSFDDLGLQALERLHLQVIPGAGRKTHTGRRDDLELRHPILLSRWKLPPATSPALAGSAHYADVGRRGKPADFGPIALERGSATTQAG